MKKIFLLLFIIQFRIFPNAIGEETNLNAVVSNVAPFAYLNKQGDLSGHNVEILKKLEKLSGLKFIYDLIPHARVVKMGHKDAMDILIIFKKSCTDFGDAFEIQASLYHAVPSIMIKEKIKPDKNMRIGRLTGTCTKLANQYINPENIVNLNSMVQGHKMVLNNRLEGLCGLPQVIAHDSKLKLNFYKSQSPSADFEAVLCRRKSLPTSVKHKLDLAALKL